STHLHLISLFRQLRPPTRLHLFPYTPLFRSDETVAAMRTADLLFLPMQGLSYDRPASIVPGKTYEYLASRRPGTIEAGRSYDNPDRKSTRLNSSHVAISYAVFCLKKKKNKPT